MNTTVREPDEAPVEDDEEDRELPEGRPLSIWFWIVPLLLMFTFLGFFWNRHRHDPPPASIKGVNVMPQLGVVQFDSGKPTLTEDGEATLDRAAEVMHGNPNVHLRLEGYDLPPARPRKQDHPRDPLTLQRALSVQRYLDGKGIERNRITGGQPAYSATSSTNSFPAFNGDSRRAELYVQ